MTLAYASSRASGEIAASITLPSLVRCTISKAEPWDDGRNIEGRRLSAIIAIAESPTRIADHMRIFRDFDRRPTGLFDSLILPVDKEVEVTMAARAIPE